MSARAGTPKVLTAQGPSGLVGTIGVTVEAPDGTDAIPRTTAGITETSPGVYAITITAPSTPGEYVVTWDYGPGEDHQGVSTLEVTAPPADPAAPVILPGDGPPIVNAALLEVRTATAATGRDDWDTPEGQAPTGAGALKFSGEQPAYYREKVDRVSGADGVTLITRYTLWISSGLARDTGVDTDDELLIRTPAGDARRARALTVAISELAEAPEVSTARLDLEPLE